MIKVTEYFKKKRHTIKLQYLKFENLELLNRSFDWKCVCTKNIYNFEGLKNQRMSIIVSLIFSEFKYYTPTIFFHNSFNTNPFDIGKNDLRSI